MNIKTALELLELKPNATPEQVKRGEKMKQCKRDKNGIPKDEEGKFYREVNIAGEYEWAQWRWVEISRAEYIERTGNKTATHGKIWHCPVIY